MEEVNKTETEAVGAVNGVVNGLAWGSRIRLDGSTVERPW